MLFFFYWSNAGVKEKQNKSKTIAKQIASAIPVKIGNAAFESGRNF